MYTKGRVVVVLMDDLTLPTGLRDGSRSSTRKDVDRVSLLTGLLFNAVSWSRSLANFLECPEELLGFHPKAKEESDKG